MATNKVSDCHKASTIYVKKEDARTKSAWQLMNTATYKVIIYKIQT